MEKEKDREKEKIGDKWAKLNEKKSDKWDIFRWEVSSSFTCKKKRKEMYKESVLHVQSCFFAN